MTKNRKPRATGRRLGAALLASALLLVFAAVALALEPKPGTYTGNTGQGRPVTLTVGSKHRVHKFTIDWKATCDKADKFYTGSTQDIDGSNDRIKQPQHGTFSDTGEYNEPAGSFRGHVKVELNGEFTSPTEANGLFKVHVRVTRASDGKFVDKCHKTTHWYVPGV